MIFLPIGFVFARLMRYAHRKGLIDRESFVAQYLALAIFTIGIANTLGSDDLLAAFAAGRSAAISRHVTLLTFWLLRECGFMGWPFQRPHRGRGLLVSH